jgi:hypothetical protein
VLLILSFEHQAKATRFARTLIRLRHLLPQAGEGLHPATRAASGNQGCIQQPGLHRATRAASGHQNCIRPPELHPAIRVAPATKAASGNRNCAGKQNCIRQSEHRQAALHPASRAASGRKIGAAAGCGAAL